jgi:hypothetical protein
VNDALTTATAALVIVTGCLVLVAVAALVVNVVQARATGKAVNAAIHATEAATRQAEASEKLAEASVRQAEASERLAEEAQRTREIEWQPLLDYDRIGSISNTGRGHAYRTVLVVPDGDGLVVTRPPFLVGATSQSKVGYAVGCKDPGGILPDASDWGLFCEDQFGNMYRFLDVGARPEVCRPDDDQSVVSWLMAWRLAEPMRFPRP